jgi:endo-1,4-beta-mannosidase
MPRRTSAPVLLFGLLFFVPVLFAQTELAIVNGRFELGGKPVFLYGISYYGALGAPRNLVLQDLDDMQTAGFNWIRVWANWQAFGQPAYAVDAQGEVDPDGMARLNWLVEECDRRHLVIDVTLSRGNGVTGPPRLQTFVAHEKAVRALVTQLSAYRNWYLDLSNERNLRDERFASFADLQRLRDIVRQLDPGRLVTASHAGDPTEEEIRDYLSVAKVDFLSPHRPRRKGTAEETQDRTRAYLETMTQLGRVVPVHYQEPFRRGFGDWNPSPDDFVVDAWGARKAGAAGWCLHNGDQRNSPDGWPRRSFDMRQKRLFEQLDTEERVAIARLKKAVGEDRAEVRLGRFDPANRDGDREGPVED